MAATGGQIAEFFGTLGFRIDKASITQFDKTLNALELKAKRFSEESLSNVRVNISRFSFSDDFNTRLHRAMKGRMTAVSNMKGMSPEITVNKFDVDKQALLRDMRDAVRYVENNLRVRITPDVQPTSMGSQGVSGGGSGGIASRTAMGAGLGAGAASLGRGFVPGLGFAFGVSQLNKQVQEIKGQELAAQAILGSQEAGTATMQWLRDFSEEAGVDYRRQGQAYNNMLASGTQIGIPEEEVQSIFAGVTRYGRTYGLNSEQMRGGMKAIEQMINKGQVYAEELRQQLKLAA